MQPLELKQCCRLAILNLIGRESYTRISGLPLPQHLKASNLTLFPCVNTIGADFLYNNQDYTSYYKEWGPPCPPLKILCPIDHSKKQETSSDDEQGVEEGGAKGGQAHTSRGPSSQHRGGARRRGTGGGASPGEGGGDSSSKRRGKVGGSSLDSLLGPSRQAYAMQAFVNGRKSLICNINGVFVKVLLRLAHYCFPKNKATSARVDV